MNYYVMVVGSAFLVYFIYNYIKTRDGIFLYSILYPILGMILYYSTAKLSFWGKVISFLAFTILYFLGLILYIFIYNKSKDKKE